MNEPMEEEFNNFMHKVTEIEGIMKKLTSDDKCLNEIGQVEAERYLGTKDEKIIEGDVKLRVKCNRTIINTIKQEENKNEMSKDAFMKGVERDANKRYKDKQVRKEKSNTLKTQANKAFKRGEYAKALSLYNRAIEYIKDSCVLYTNRALCYIHLEFYEKSIENCETALKLNENSLKAMMLMAKAYYLNGDETKMRDIVAQCIEIHKEYKDFINDYFDALCNLNKSVYVF